MSVLVGARPLKITKLEVVAFVGYVMVGVGGATGPSFGFSGLR
jgi:hypothetical protein